MTAKEKAEEIYDKYSDLAVFTKHTAINYSIIHVKGIIEEVRWRDQKRVIYWIEVLNELNQM